MLGLMMGVAAWSYFFYRATYNHAKRLRVVQQGKFYRCGQLTADGFADAVKRLGIRTVVNVQDDVPDPAIWKNYVDRRRQSEKELCTRLGVRYVWLAPDLVPPDAARRGERPLAIDQFVRLCDDPSIYPVLLHCKAGLHRTGRLTAIYRMEYEGWDTGSALRELRANGYGYTASSESDDFVIQFVQNYKPRAMAASTGGEK